MSANPAPGWQYYNPVRLLQGAGVAARLADFLPPGAILLLSSAGMIERGVIDQLISRWPARDWTVRSVAPNPELDALDALARTLRTCPFTAVVAVGGGSVIDAAKALALALPNGVDGALARWLRQQPPMPAPATALPLFCLPTTAGTGAEVTPFATVWDGRARRKLSLASPALHPRLALLDPELSLSLPWRATLHSALDTLSHALETLWNRHATPVSQTLALGALQRVVAELPDAARRLHELALRTALQDASVLAGLAISQNRTALAHAISYPLTAHYGVPHGLACSFTLAALLHTVRSAHALPTSIPATLLDQTSAVLAQFALGEQISQYCRPDRVLQHIDEMFDPARADNFVLELDRDQVLAILRTSLA